MKNWYDYNIKDRYEQIYKQFTIEKFWDWWSDGTDEYMEVRITNFAMMKEYSKAYRVPMSASGMFINKAWQLEKIVKHFKDKATIWFGVNPKRKLINKYGYKSFSGKDINISKIKYLFLDIDRVIKDGQATNEDLMNCDFLAEKILEELGNAGFNKNYCKICSGNGVQVLIKLDVPFEIPIPEYNEDTKTYIEDIMFNTAKQVIHKGIGKILPLFSNKFKETYNVEVDDTCFNMGRVGALPYSFNLKYDIPVPRGIVCLVDNDKNDGLSDYLREIQVSQDVRKTVSNKFKQKTDLILSSEHKMMQNELHKNVIIHLMYNHTFPSGGINNTLWYGVKILLHNNGIDNTDNEFINIHSQLRSIHGRGFTENGLEPRYKNSFDGAIKEDDINVVPSMVNKYLRLHKIKKVGGGQEGYHKPIFPISPRGKKIEDIVVNILPKLLKIKCDEKYHISSIMDDPLKDLTKASKYIYGVRRGEGLDDIYKIDQYNFTDIGNIMVLNNINNKIASFLQTFRNKWGDEITIYMMRYYMDDYFNYRRW